MRAVALPVVVGSGGSGLARLLGVPAHPGHDAHEHEERAHCDAHDGRQRQAFLRLLGALVLIAHLDAHLVAFGVQVGVVLHLEGDGEGLGHRLVVGVLILYSKGQVEGSALRRREGHADVAALARLDVAHVHLGRFSADAVARDAHGNVGHSALALVHIGEGQRGLAAHGGVVGRGGRGELEAVGLVDGHGELDVGVRGLALLVLDVLVLEADGDAACCGLLAGYSLQVEGLLLRGVGPQACRIEGVRAVGDGELVARVHGHHEVLHGKARARVGEGEGQREGAARRHGRGAVAVGEVGHDDVGDGLGGGAGRRGLRDGAARTVVVDVRAAVVIVIRPAVVAAGVGAARAAVVGVPAVVARAVVGRAVGVARGEALDGHAVLGAALREAAVRLVAEARVDVERLGGGCARLKGLHRHEHRLLAVCLDVGQGHRGGVAHDDQARGGRERRYGLANRHVARVLEGDGHLDGLAGGNRGDVGAACDERGRRRGGGGGGWVATVGLAAVGVVGVHDVASRAISAARRVVGHVGVVHVVEGGAVCQRQGRCRRAAQAGGEQSRAEQPCKGD